MYNASAQNHSNCNTLIKLILWTRCSPSDQWLQVHTDMHFAFVILLFTHQWSYMYTSSTQADPVKSSVDQVGQVKVLQGHIVWSYD